MITHNSPPARAPGRLTRALCSFWRDSAGSVTVEFVIWVPVVCSLLMLFVDTSLAYMRQSNFWNVSRETARIVARHGFDAAAAEEYAEAQAGFGDYRPQVRVQIDGVAVTVTISADASALTPFGMLDFALSQTIRASVTNVMEPI